ncbi:hypothetical protein DM2_1237 [Halorubrum sp. DM2]|nr:hypothetical protein DM2_1237 [Halorubrum sp. DM2]
MDPSCGAGPRAAGTGSRSPSRAIPVPRSLPRRAPAESGPSGADSERPRGVSNPPRHIFTEATTPVVNIMYYHNNLPVKIRTVAGVKK